jgi:DNA-binding transcriptional LysR family regulator
LGLADLQNLSFIALAGSGPVGRKLQSELVRQGLVMNEVATASTIHMAAALVRQGVGVAVVDSFTARAMAEPEIACRPLEPKISFEIHAISLESRPLSRAANSFVKELATLIAQHRRGLWV